MTETDLVNNITTQEKNCDETFDSFVDGDTADEFSNTWSNWDNILSYIKLNLGSSVNNVEFTDDEIINILEEHVLPEFSKYCPLIRYYVMFETENVISRHPVTVFQFKKFKYKIMNVNKLIFRPNLMDISQTYQLQQNSGDLTDMLISQNYFSAAKDFVSPNTWKFFGPDKLQFIKGTVNFGSNMDFICELNCIHKDPTTINPDVYNFFRDLSLSYIFIYIGRIRNKFSTFNTPQSQIDLNSSEMLQEGQSLRDKTIQELEELPPDNYVWFMN